MGVGRGELELGARFQGAERTWQKINPRKIEGSFEEVSWKIVAVATIGMKGDFMASAQRILSFGLSVILLAFAFAASSLAQNRPVKTYVSHAAATLTDVPYYIAREKKFYLDEGLDVNSLFVQGRALSIQVLTAGSVDFSLATGSGTRAALTGAPVKAIFVLNDKPFYVLYGRPDLGVQKAGRSQRKEDCRHGRGLND